MNDAVATQIIKASIFGSMAAIMSGLPPLGMVLLALPFAVFGTSFAKKKEGASAFWSAAMFGSVLFGTAYAAHAFGPVLNAKFGGTWGEFAICAAVGLLFHPLANSIAEHVPALVRAGVGKITTKGGADV